MRNISLRDAKASDFDAILALNASEVQHTSPLNLERFCLLDALSNYHKTALVMKDGCAYINENFEWFSSRYDSFLYIDRVVVSPSYSGLKLGTLLYRDLFAYARINHISNIVCEYNVIPPNEPSRLFHDKFSFRQVGTQWLGNKTKMVSLQSAKA